MIHFSLISVFVEHYKSFMATGILGKAQEKGLFSVDYHSYFSAVKPLERIDSPTCGPGPGMLIRPDVVQKVLETCDAQHGRSFKIFFSPQGTRLDQNLLRDLYHTMRTYRHCALVSARYEGMDARVESAYADAVISLGDFVLMSGDLPALAFLESYVRLIPDVIGNAESVTHESFQKAFVDYPEYTHPVIWEGQSVPSIVLSGNHAAIAHWRHEQAVTKTVFSHFQWVKRSPVMPEEKKQVMACIPPHYAALLHGDVLVGPEKKIGCTSVTSLDIHDIARSCRTYGVEKFFIVTPLYDQKIVVETLLDFWKQGHGCEYNPSRHDAVKRADHAATLEQVCAEITAHTGKKPLIIATSAQNTSHAGIISFYDQEKVWSYNRPILFIFGTGQGIAPHVIDLADFLLPPVTGFTEFNHLSVRTAAGVIFDRWLGNNPRQRTPL